MRLLSRPARRRGYRSSHHHRLRRHRHCRTTDDAVLYTEGHDEPDIVSGTLDAIFALVAAQQGGEAGGRAAFGASFAESDNGCFFFLFFIIFFAIFPVLNQSFLFHLILHRFTFLYFIVMCHFFREQSAYF